MTPTEIQTLILTLGLPLAGVVVSIAVAVFLALTWAKRRVEGAADRAVASSIEKEKHSLNVALEQHRLDHQRLMHDFTLFADRRRLWYERTFHAILRAEGAAIGPTGFVESVDVSEASAEQIKTEFSKHKFPQGEVDECLSLWVTDRPAGVERFEKLMARAALLRAVRLQHKAKNVSLLGEIYLSDEVRLAVSNANKAIWTVIGFRQFPDAFDGESYHKASRAAEAAVNAVRSLMQKELARGDYAKAAVASGTKKAALTDGDRAITSG